MVNLFMKYILASESIYKKQLLSRVLKDFDQITPGVDETIFKSEQAPDAAVRLALKKGQIILESNPNSLIISSDQVAVADGRILQKPGSDIKAIDQLSYQSGKMVEFFTCVCVTKAAKSTGVSQSHKLSRTQAHFKTLTKEQIESYVLREQSYNSTGAFKAEGFGIALFRKLSSDDPTSILGLPLIDLVSLLSQFDIDVFLNKD